MLWGRATLRGTVLQGKKSHDNEKKFGGLKLMQEGPREPQTPPNPDCEEIRKACKKFPNTISPTSEQRRKEIDALMERAKKCITSPSTCYVACKTILEEEKKKLNLSVAQPTFLQKKTEHSDSSQLAERRAQLAKQRAQLAERRAQLAKQRPQLAEQKSQGQISREKDFTNTHLEISRFLERHAKGTTGTTGTTPTTNTSKSVIN